MKRKFNFILSFIFLMSIFILFNSHQVQASSISDYEVVTETKAIKSTVEEKIMKYDKETNTTTEVDMDEIKQLLASKTSKEKGANAYTTSSYNPNKNFNILSPYSTFAMSTYLHVSDTSKFPYSTISKITCDGGHASGTIIGKNLAITAAHCVMDGNANVYSNWSIMPGYNNGAIFGSTGWSQIYYSSAWASDHSPQNDWCICVLGDNIGSNSGWCGLRSYSSDSGLNNQNANAYGYPATASFSGTEQWYTGGKISNVTSGSYDIGTTFYGRNKWWTCFLVR